MVLVEELEQKAAPPPITELAKAATQMVLQATLLALGRTTAGIMEKIVAILLLNVTIEKKEQETCSTVNETTPALLVLGIWGPTNLVGQHKVLTTAATVRRSGAKAIVVLNTSKVTSTNAACKSNK